VSSARFSGSVSFLRRFAALVAAGAVAVGMVGLHGADHGLGETLTREAATLAACPDGLRTQHIDVLRKVDLKPCAVCLLAHLGLGELRALSPTLEAPATDSSLAYPQGARPAGPGIHPRRSRGPPPSPVNA
jgi:hypothetical protein